MKSLEERLKQRKKNREQEVKNQEVQDEARLAYEKDLSESNKKDSQKDNQK